MGDDSPYTAEEKTYFETRGGEDAADTAAAAPAPAPAAPAAGAAAGDGGSVIAPAAAPGAAAEGAAADPQAPVPTHVPVAELMEERTRYRTARDEADRLRVQNETLVARAQQILEQFNRMPAAGAAPAAAQPAAAAEEVPDINREPLKFIQYALEQQNKRINETAEQVQARARQEQEAQTRVTVERTIRDEASRQEAVFKQSTPDYDKAIQHLVGSRHEQFKALGIADERQRNMLIQNETLAIAARAIETGANPAALAYQLAKTVGYAPAAAPAAAAAAAPAITDAQKLAMVAAGQAEHRPGVGSAAGEASVPLTVERMLEMSPEAFAKAIKTKAGRDLMGQ